MFRRRVMRKDFSLPLSWAHLRPTVIAFGLNCGQDDCPDLGVEMCEHYRKTIRLLGLLIICHLANFTVITKKQSLTTGSTEVQTCPTAWPVLIAHACCVCVYVCANFIDKNYARLEDKGICPHVSQLDSAKNQRTMLKQRIEQGEGKHRRKVNCHRLRLRAHLLS